jgi:hypothetical protein
MAKVKFLRVKFPRRRADGSFCLEVILSVVTQNERLLAQRIQQWWTSEWGPENEVWTRYWSSGLKEELAYRDEFSRLPQIVSCKDTELRFRLEGRGSAEGLVGDAEYWRPQGTFR